MNTRSYHKLTPTRLLMADTALPRLSAEELAEYSRGAKPARQRASGAEEAPSGR